MLRRVFDDAAPHPCTPGSTRRSTVVGIFPDRTFLDVSTSAHLDIIDV
ncbi:MAG: hypothetical protein ACYCU5_11020 [Actinomycetes bacterium]